MTDAPDVVLIGGTDELYIAEEGRAFHVGDVMPRTLTHERRLSLQAAGIKFETRHDVPADPQSKPVGQPAPAAEPAQDAPSIEDEAEAPRRAASKE